MTAARPADRPACPAGAAAGDLSYAERPGVHALPQRCPAPGALAAGPPPARPADPAPVPAPGSPAGHRGPEYLAIRVFRALYPGLDLHAERGTFIAVPRGTPYIAGPSLGDVARTISEREPPGHPGDRDRGRPG